MRSIDNVQGKVPKTKSGKIVFFLKNTFARFWEIFLRLFLGFNTSLNFLSIFNFLFECVA